MPDNPLLAYGRWLADRPRDWPAGALEAAQRQYIDLVAVMIAGAAEPVSARVFEAVQDWGDGPCVVVGRQRRLSAPWAALVNGTAAHALDFDDNFDPAKAHASAVLIPAILALGQQEGASGPDALDAYVAGLQILGRVGQGVNPVHRNRGWHATATVGAVGAAAACARLLRLDATRAGFALSIATSLAGGFMSQFGTMTKPIHAGFAARSGILAASLARAGVDAGLATLDGPHGMNRLMVGPDYEVLRDGLVHVEHGQTLTFETEAVGDPLLILSSGFRVKRFPNCGSAHRAMDGLLELIGRLGFSAEQVAEIHVRAPATHLANLMYDRPANGLEAKFSLEYGLALLLATGRCTLGDFTDEAAARSEIRAFYPRIHRHPVDRAEGEFPTEVEVRLKDGRQWETKVAMPVGSLAAPFTLDQLWAKLEDCTFPLLVPGGREDVHAALAGLPRSESLERLMTPLAFDLSRSAARR